MAGPCVEEEGLRAYLLGELPAERAEAVARHLANCPGCEASAARLDDTADHLVRSLRRVLRPTAGGDTAWFGVCPAKGALPARVNGHEVLSELGRGGMSVVYLARQARPERLVALKMILAGGHASPEERMRFLGEADAIARLQHPNIVQIYEVGEADGLPYFSLEYLSGGSLEKQLGGLPQPPARAAALAEKLARALHHAHAQGIIHRDLKPGNVLLAADGSPRVADFGLARRGEGGLTATGAVMGTPSYMAPEQAAGKAREVGPAADVYSLGAILYELLTGRPPFRAATAVDTLVQVVHDEPVPPTRLQPKVSHDLETICLKCLHKAPARRYATAEALAEDLRRFLAGEAIVARAVGRLERAGKWARRSPGWAVGLVACLALVLTVAIGSSVAALLLQASLHRAEEAKREARVRLFESYLEKARAQRSSQRAGQRFGALDTIRQAAELARELDLPADRYLALRNEAVGALALHDLRELHRWPCPSDAGVVVAFSPSLDQYARMLPDGALTVRRVADDSELARLEGFGGLTEGQLLFSPDGRWLAAWRKASASLRLWRLGPAPPALVWERPTAPWRTATFGPGGLAFARPDGTIEIAGPEQGGRRALPPVEEAPGCEWAGLGWSPDGARLAVAARLRGQPVVLIRDAVTGEVLDTLRGAGTRCFAPTWHPAGRLLAVADDNELRVYDTVRRVWTMAAHVTHTGGRSWRSAPRATCWRAPTGTGRPGSGTRIPAPCSSRPTRTWPTSASPPIAPGWWGACGRRPTCASGRCPGPPTGDFATCRRGTTPLP